MMREKPWAYVFGESWASCFGKMYRNEVSLARRRFTPVLIPGGEILKLIHVCDS
jgi:hypothetical protein